ncbi:MAG: hypothetical protein C4560_03085 [Nitrospiraceae bacterium]|nr:MAG: hypothetical protein C4560_03085 [Nitrospiraceae bacterium]
MKDWIPIFKTGTHTDSAGNTKDWTEQDLDNIVQKFSPQIGAPLVIGHPKDNAPAYGWVEGLKRVGQMLYYKPMQVIEEFKEMINKGLFKKRSISLYPDGTLRHIGYLGAMPPAVKGLPDHTFMAEEDAATYEFSEYRMTMLGGMFQRLRDFLIEKFGTEAADRIVSAYEIDELKRDDSVTNDNLMPAYSGKGKEDITMSFIDKLKNLMKSEGMDVSDIPAGKSFTEAEVKEMVTQAVQKATADFTEATKKKETEFSEKETALKQREDALKKQETESKKKAVTEFCEDLKKQGKLIPAMDNLGMGLTEFMHQIATIETTIEFGEGADKKKQTPLEFMQDFLTALPKQIEFGEVAKRSTDTAPAGGNAGEKIEALVQQRMKENKELNYTQAFAEVQKEYPELTAEYAEEMRGGN